MRRLFFRPSWRLPALCGLLFVAAGCVDREPEQRAAFIRFLQARVIEAPGRAVRAPVGEERDALGEYVVQYEVIGDFQEALDDALDVQARVLEALSLHSVGELLARADAFEDLRGDLARSRETLQRAREVADEARGGLLQADDLKRVYAAAYDKAVTRAAADALALCPACDPALQDAGRAAAYARAQDGQILLDGALVQVRDPSVRTQLNTLLQALNAHSDEIGAAQRRLRALRPPGG